MAQIAPKIAKNGGKLGFLAVLGAENADFGPQKLSSEVILAEELSSEAILLLSSEVILPGASYRAKSFCCGVMRVPILTRRRAGEEMVNESKTRGAHG